MIKQSYVLATIICLCVTSAMAKNSDKQGISIQGLDEKSARIYLDGVADGFQVLNTALLQQGKDPLYCIPEKIVLYGRDLLEFISSKVTGSQEGINVAISALFALRNKYPCQHKVKAAEHRSIRDIGQEKP